jgi:hypothetical protein
MSSLLTAAYSLIAVAVASLSGSPNYAGNPRCAALLWEGGCVISLALALLSITFLIRTRRASILKGTHKHLEQ